VADVRSDIGKALTGKLTKDQIKYLIDEVLAIKKKANCEFVCKKCSQRQMQWAEVIDTEKVVSALTKLADQAWGRPTEVKEADGVKVNYRVVLSGDNSQ
jgi:hypothetical protein